MQEQETGRLAGSVGRVIGAALMLLTMTGCVAVGYSSGSGWFVWPGGIGLLVIVLLILFLLRRGR